MKHVFTIRLSFFQRLCALFGISRYQVRFVEKAGKKKPTIGQLQQWQKFKLTSEIVKPMQRFLPVTYAQVFGAMSPVDKAFSYHFKNAIIGRYPDCTIDFNAVRVSRGQLYNAHTAESYCTSGKIYFNWKNLTINNASDDDISILVVFCPAKKKCIYNLTGPLRSEENAKLDVSEFKGHVVHTYLAFMSANGLLNSDSKYTGRHIIN